MKRISLAVVTVLFVVFLLPEPAEARWRPFKRIIGNRSARRGNYSDGNYSSSYSNYAITGDPQAVAEQKVGLLANAGYGYHPAGGYGGANAEGWGFSTYSAQDALNKCCFAGQKTVAGQATAVGPSKWGQGWYAIRIYW